MAVREATGGAEDDSAPIVLRVKRKRTEDAAEALGMSLVQCYVDVSTITTHLQPVLIQCARDGVNLLPTIRNTAKRGRNHHTEV